MPEPPAEQLPEEQPSEEQPLVPVLTADSPETLAEMVELLQGVDIPAVADVRAEAGHEVLRVLVPRNYAPVAQMMLDATTHKPLGPASTEEIEAALLDPAWDPDADDAAAEQPELHQRMASTVVFWALVLAALTSLGVLLWYTLQQA